MSWWQKKSDILGVNARNLLYINKYNTKLGKTFADDKIFTKNYLQSRNIGAARLYATIRSHKELENFNPQILPASFVMKPNHGYGGEGILIIKDTKNNHYIGSGNKKYTWHDLHNECASILDGKYSLSGLKDQVIFEELLVIDDYFKDFTDSGLPDIRIIVFNLVPVMAMLRLPTKDSGGRANLHMGAIGLGIDIGTGHTTFGVQKGKFITRLPNGKNVSNIKIPKWDEILLTASKIQQISKVGFVGVDLTYTKTGIKILEINARAGLYIQIANRAPLKIRLKKVADMSVGSPEEAIQIAKTLFAKSKQKPDAASTKPIIGLYEDVEILNTKFGHIKAKIDPHANRNLVDKSMKEEIGDGLMSIKIAGKRINTPVHYGDLSKHGYKLILAGKSLKDFLINITDQLDTADKKEVVAKKESKEEKILKNIDRKVFEIDKRLGIIPRVRPINLDKEKEVFLENPGYSPKFIYKKIVVDLEAVKKEIKKIPKIVNHPLALIYEAKIKEMQRKISLLEARGTERIQYQSEKLYGRVNKEIFHQALDFIDKFTVEEDQSEILSFKKVVKRLEDYLKEKKISHWKIKIIENSTADISVSKNNTIFIKKDVEFSDNRLKSIIAHEIETHILRLENARLQPYKIFEVGLSGYLMTEEGLAIYNQRSLNLALGKRTIWPAINTIAIYLGRKMSFGELALYLIDRFSLTEEEAWKVCAKVKRGLIDTEAKASFSRDFIYFEGYNMIDNFVKEHGLKELKNLYIGKVGLHDMTVLKDIPSLKVKYYPDFYSK